MVPSNHRLDGASVFKMKNKVMMMGLELVAKKTSSLLACPTTLAPYLEPIESLCSVVCPMFAERHP